MIVGAILGAAISLAANAGGWLLVVGIVVLAVPLVYAIGTLFGVDRP